MKQFQFLPVCFIIIIVQVFFLTSCVVYPTGTDPFVVDESRQKENLYYIPASPNSPLLTEKNDLSLTIQSAAGSNFHGIEMQTAYMPGKHVGITGSYFGNARLSNYYKFVNHSRFELGTGYVTKLSEGWHFETYAGFGTGKINNIHYTGSSRLNYNLIFLQPAIAISSKKQTVQLAISSRFAGVNYTVQDTLFSTDREPYSTKNLISLYDKPFQLMWEPSMIFRLGWKNFLFNAQYTLSSDLTNPDLYRAKNNFSLGATLRFNTGEKKPVPKPE